MIKQSKIIKAPLCPGTPSISPLITESPMKQSIALVTGATSGLGRAAARALAEEGWGEIIITGRSLAKVQETAAQLTAETQDATHGAGLPDVDNGPDDDTKYC